MTEIKKMIYTGKYTDWTREDLLSEVQSKVKKSRFEHILRVEKCALELAERYGADTEACSLAALLHDYAKDLPQKRMERIVAEEGWDPQILEYGSSIWHGPAGAYFAETIFAITDEDILTAIRDHTIGGETMSLVGKILFIADYIEAGRSFPGVEEARQLAKKNLEQAAMYKITRTLIHLVEKGVVVYPGTLTVYNTWASKGEGSDSEQ